MKRITIKELAERLGLSPSTVSRALAGDRNIRRETRERVSRLAGELGIRVPAQMAVAGYSGTVLSTIVNPQLTTVEQPLDEMGCRAAELILEKIADPSAPDRTVTLTACIRERASTAR